MTRTSPAANTLEFDGVSYLSGLASNPRELRWMYGAPPPADRRVTFEGDNFVAFPQMRWSLSHLRELMPTANIRRGRGAPAHFERAERTAEIDALEFADMNGRHHRFGETALDTYTDGILVLHRGRIVYERYAGALEPHLPHACHSVTKSYAATLAAAFVHEGVLDDSKRIPHYVPELKGSAWEEATLRNVMDMQTGLDYSEVYADPAASIWEYARAAGFRSRPAGYSGAESCYDYLRSVQKAGVHGGAFAYKTVNTEVLAWVMTRVAGRSLIELLHERLWVPLGCEEDGYITVDPAGTPMAGGGLCATLRDAARFGELMRCEGNWNGRQLIPASVVHETSRGDDPAKFAQAGYLLRHGYSYRNMWWVSHNELDAIEAIGIHGQRIYVAPKAEMVVVHFGSHPVAAATAHEPIMTPQLIALGRMLRGA